MSNYRYEVWCMNREALMPWINKHGPYHVPAKECDIERFKDMYPEWTKICSFENDVLVKEELNKDFEMPVVPLRPLANPFYGKDEDADLADGFVQGFDS